MKKIPLILCLSAVGSLCVAGPQPYSGKEKQIIPPPPCEWYHAGEWEVDLWAAYAFTDEDHNKNFHFTPSDYVAADNEFDRTGNPVFVGESEHGGLGDHAWGGGGDVKYFWSRNFGVGLEGFGLAGDNTAGAVLGTLTLRFPIGCSRFAPYVFGGVGGLFGGDITQTDFFFSEQHVGPGEEGEVESVTGHANNNDNARVIGQVGGGLQVRFTRPSEVSRMAVGMMADFTWNFTGGDNNQDFGMARVGLTFGF